MKRKYYPYTQWEEHKYGMWKILSTEERNKYADVAASIMKDENRFKIAMLDALDKWPISCEVNLSARCMNRRAWLGHAGCCVDSGCPEEATRQGWHYLSEEEQQKANIVADEVILEWENRYAKTVSR